MKLSVDKTILPKHSMMIFDLLWPLEEFENLIVAKTLPFLFKICKCKVEVRSYHGYHYRLAPTFPVNSFDCLWSEQTPFTSDFEICLRVCCKFGFQSVCAFVIICNEIFVAWEEFPHDPRHSDRVRHTFRDVQIETARFAI